MNRYRWTALAVAGIFMAATITGCGAMEKKSDIATEIQEENKLILYTSHKEEVYGPIVKEFEERTGIWVDVYDGGTTQVLDKLRLEEGQGTCDVMFGGGVESYEAYRECFEPYRCSKADLLDSRYNAQDDLWTPFTELPIVFIYNSKMVSEEEAPETWGEFLDGTWKGKTAFADPGNSGTSYTAVATMLQIEKGEYKTQLKRFTDNLDGHILAGSGDVMTEVKAGLSLVGITLEEAARKEIAMGADISMIYPKDGTSAVPDGCALVKGAPHEENAKLFIDFVLSDDVQNLAMEQFCRRSVRTDMPQQLDEVPGAGQLKIADFDLQWAGEHQEEILTWWRELAGGEDET